MAPRASREDRPQLRPHPAQVTTRSLGAPSTAQAPRPSAPLQPPCSQACCLHPEQTSVPPGSQTRKGRKNLPKPWDQGQEVSERHGQGSRHGPCPPQPGVKTRLRAPEQGASLDGSQGRLRGWGACEVGARHPHTQKTVQHPQPDLRVPSRQPCTEGPAVISSHLSSQDTSGRGWHCSASSSTSLQGSTDVPVPSESSLSSPRSNDLTSAPDCVSCLHGTAGVPALRHYTCSIKQTQAAGLHAHFRELTSPFNSKLHGDNSQVPGPGRPRHGSSGSVSPIYQALPRPSPANPLCRQ